MACAGYQEKLIEAALDPESAVAREAGFVRHIESCAVCRAELERQRALYSKIEGGIEALVNVSVPPAIAARVRQEISAGPSSAFAWGNWAWLTAAGIAAMAVLLALMYRPTVAPQQPAPVQLTSHSAQVAPLAPAIPTPQNAASAIAPMRSTRTPKIAAAHAAALEPPQLSDVAVNAPIGPPRVEVIVPAGQREAVLRLASALQTGNVDLAGILAPLPQSLQPADLQIAPLEIKPLDAPEAAGNTISPDPKPSIRN
ncbi:MAG TPA: hypothetical protein VFO34_09015 [Candidatus Acidoferrales bacterium]|nr:hypothetical protein [Candidatus Acidoferrales bacterium]